VNLRNFVGELKRRNVYKVAIAYAIAAWLLMQIASLGRAFFSGTLGVAKDETEAVKWYRKAAEQNVADAQYNLGVCYDSGEGVAKDEIEAYKWWLLAAGHGNDDAKYNMTIVENKMTREQFAEGQRLARDFKPRKVPPEGSDARLPP
jgi:Sel1 repeat